jgi:hypothetical protein
MRALVLLAAATIVACSAAAERRGFGEAATNETESEPPPEKTTTSTPTPPSPDPPKEPDTCKRSAPSNACGVFPQCGCSASETCDVADTAGNAACVPHGKAKMGAACTHTVGCAKGLTCVFGTCHAFCGAAGACGQPGTSDCIQVTAAGNAPVPNLAVCLVSCDLRDPMSCGGTTSAGTGVCVVGNDGKTDCQEGGTMGVNQTCDSDCGPGLVCTIQGTGTTGTCKRWCRVGTNDCGGAAVCSGFSPAVVVNGVQYGRCP